MTDSTTFTGGGATVTIATPSEQIVKAAAKTFDVTDESGRTITLKKPGVLAQYRFVEALGPLALNKVYMGMTMPLVFVTAIDGVPVALPGSKGEIEALISRLDEAGLDAVMTCVQENFGGATAEDSAKKSAE